MSLTGIVFMAAFFATMALAVFRHPIYGLYAYIALFYLHPPDRWWGSGLPDLRWTLTAAIVTLVASLRLPSDPARPSWLSQKPARLLVAFTVWVWIQSYWAILPEMHSFFATLYLKYVVLFYLIYRLVDSPERIRGFLTVNFLGCVFLGWLAYSASSSGRLEGVGGPGIDEANALGMQLATGVLTGAMLLLHLKGWRRWMLVLGMPFLLNGLVLTQSRSAFLGLAAGGLMLWFLKPKSHRKVFYLFAVLAVVLGGMLAHDLFWKRMGTVVTAVERPGEIDQSAESRVALFHAQVAMAKAHPFGAGHRGTLGLSPDYLDERYMDTLSDGSGRLGRSSHSTLMSVLVEQGLPGIAIIAALGWWYFGVVARLRRLARGGADDSSSIIGAGLAAALAAVAVAGIFVDYVKAEIQIWCAALLVTMLLHQQRLPQQQQAASSTRAMAPRSATTMRRQN